MSGYRQARWVGGPGVLEPTVFELSHGSGFYRFDVERGILEFLGVEDPADVLPEGLVRSELRLPSLSEPEVARHFSRLAQMNYGVDSGPYWLGSCTMKYNPKIANRVTSWPTVRRIHPYQPEETVQGALRLMYELCHMLAEITGLPHFTLQPAAG
ncbi:MAG TPA: aminomethyl-transferring glycine dehydrogenase subunit GcvPB, partial [Candidatus Korarchaeota archaeon]|nr:aminomethyl-transferring glycine dehydrogenase subunit GcvPB [Candidatus Korarchaeota archaeon]